jgi:putative endonuclease
MSLCLRPLLEAPECVDPGEVVITFQRSPKHAPMQYYVYILASGRRGTIYIGVTNDLIRRVYEHRTGAVPGFTRRYRIHRLVYFEVHEDILEAIAREKRIKRWLRKWKIELIERQNEDWHDLWPSIAGPDWDRMPT